MTSFEIVPLFPQAQYRAKFIPLTDNELSVISNYPVTKQQLGNHTSQEPYFLDVAGLEDLKAEFKNHIDVYAAEIMKVSWELYLTNSWLNVNRPSEQHAQHGGSPGRGGIPCIRQARRLFGQAKRPHRLGPGLP